MYRLLVFLGPSTHHLCSCPCGCRVWAQPAQTQPPTCVLGPHASSTSSFSPSPTHTCLSSHLGPSNPAFEAFRFLSPLPLGCSLVRTGHFWGLPSRHSLGVSRRNLTAPGFLSLCRVPTPGQPGTMQIRKQNAQTWCVLPQVPLVGSITSDSSDPGPESVFVERRIQMEPQFVFGE